MTFHIKKVFSSSSSSKKAHDRSHQNFTKLESCPSVTTLGQDEAAAQGPVLSQAESEEKRKEAWEAKRARGAEAYLARHGFVSTKYSPLGNQKRIHNIQLIILKEAETAADLSLVWLTGRSFSRRSRTDVIGHCSRGRHPLTTNRRRRYDTDWRLSGFFSLLFCQGAAVLFFFFGPFSPSYFGGGGG